MFAIALRDGRTGRVLLARDRMGIKPLYFGLSGIGGKAVLLFASEVRSLLASGVFERRLDPVGLASCLWNGFVVGDGTIIRGISQLPSGTYAEIDPASPRVDPVRYWSLPARAAQPSSDIERVRACFAQTVRQHLLSDVPLGVFLSGGIDSSAIAAHAARSGVGTIKTFNVSFDEAKFDEAPYARRVADQLGTDHQEFRLTHQVFRDQADAALESLDQPTFDGINTYFVSRVVGRRASRWRLAGTGGDELFGGYRSFADLPRLQRVARLCRFGPDHR
jgi:asparagine synthase (glutamine-hydrolysing)